MKPIKFHLKPLAALAAVALAICGNSAQAQTVSDIIVGPSGTQSGTSGSNPDYEWQNLWGNASSITLSFDAATPPPSGDTTGSIYIQGTWPTSGSADSYNIGSPGNWFGAVTFDATAYATIEMDIKYDTASTITPASQAHLNIGFDAGYWFQQVTNVSFDVATAPVANGQWHHLSIPINPAQANISSVHSVAFYQWNPAGTIGTMNFWVANVKVAARVVASPPPTISPLAKPVVGLNTVASSSGLYDRHIGRLTPNTGKSWVGQATAANPVTYSFTVSNFPQGDAFINSTETLLFLIPNPTQNGAGAPDWNEANNVQVTIQQSSATNATMSFQYKVGEANGNSMYNGYDPYTNAPGSWDGVTPNYYESGNLGSITVTNSSSAGAAVGKWSVMFTSDTNVTLVAPDGTTNSFIFPAYNAAMFAESSGFNVDLGMQPNNSGAIGSTIIYSSFAVSNTVTPFYDNFKADTALLTNWDTSMSPAGSLVLVPATVAYNVTWTLPATSFSVNIATNLNNLSAGTSPSIYPVINGVGTASQFVDKSELPPGKVAFFNMIKRTFSQIQILLPGQTNAPGTALGYVGTPTPQSVSAVTPITVNAVDSTFHIINGVTDTIAITTSDTSAFLPNNAQMVNGTVTFSGASGFQFQTQPGSQTITATDTTTATIAPVTSAPVTVGP